MEKTQRTKALTLAMQIIRQFEGCELIAYRCPAGRWTIGWGETHGIQEGMTWTQQQADEALRKRVSELAENVLSACPTLEQYPYRLAACISLAYNIGISNFAGSSVAKYIRRGEYQAAADAFGLWVNAGGRKLQGLERRRRAERELYLQQP